MNQTINENIFEETYNYFESVYSEVEIDGVVYGSIIHIVRDKSRNEPNE